MNWRSISKQVRRCLSSAGGPIQFVASLAASVALYDVLTTFGESPLAALIWAGLSIWLTGHLKRLARRGLALGIFWGLRGSVLLAAVLAQDTHAAGTNLRAALARIPLLVFLEYISHIPRLISSGTHILGPGGRLLIRLGRGPYRWLHLSHTITFDDGTTPDVQAQLLRHGNIEVRKFLMSAGPAHSYRLFVDFDGDLVLALQNPADVKATVSLEILAD